MPRSKEQNAKIREATREKIQSAAGQLFAQKGLAGTNVQEIADLAGISIGLLYRHYKTKEELFREMVTFAMEGLADLTALLGSDGSPREIMLGVATEICTDLEENDDFVNTMIFLTQAFLSDPDVGDVYKLIEQDVLMCNAAAGLIKRGQESGDMRVGDAQKMAALFFATIQGLGVMKSVMKSQFPIPSPEMILAHILTERKD